jgi:branched-chain amino acid transport system permease protein
MDAKLIQLTVDALSSGGIIALFALGIALIFGVMDLINFAHASLIVVTSYSLLYLDVLPAGVALVAAIGMAVVVALATERVAFRPIRGAGEVTLLVTSFAVFYLIQNLTLLIVGGIPQSVHVLGFVRGSVMLGDVRVAKLSLVTIAVTGVLLVSLAAFLKRTPFGLQMRAAAEDFGMARLLGVRANSVVAWAFALSGVLAGCAAILFVAETGTLTPNMGFNLVLFAFVATILGGLGSLWGAVLGAFILGALMVTLQNALPLDVRPYRDAFVFIAVIVLLILLPNGLAGRRTRTA